MGFESRHRNDSPVRGDLAEDLARAHRIELDHARDVLRRAGHAAAEDPQARSVRDWFARLVNKEDRLTSATGKRTLEAPIDDGSTLLTRSQSQQRSDPGRQTLVMRERSVEDVPAQGMDWRKSRQSLLDRGDRPAAPTSEAFLVELAGSGPSLDDFRAQGLRDVLAALASMDGQRGLMRATLSVASKEQRPVRPALTSRPAPPDPAGQAMWQAAERRAATLYRRAMDSGEIKLDDPAVEQALARATGGHQLPTVLRREMELEIGIALDRVRIHTDAVAADAARALRAKAFTVGEDIFFADGAYAPETREGWKLLAHELTHVVQARQGRAATGGMGIQVSSPGESLEREADAASERVGDARASRRTPIHGAGKGGGAPLPEPVRARMESSFGADFSEVRIHHGGEAEEMDALAYAQGTDIHFAPGRYDPSSQEGLELLGHELAHVVQQARGHVEATHHANGSAVNADPALEAAADALGSQAARGEPAAVGATGGAGSANVAQRKPASEPPSAGEWVAMEVAAGAPVQAKPIQRSGNKKKTYMPHEIKVTRPMTGEEYKQAAMLQLFGGQISGLEWGGIQTSYTPEHSPYTLQVELSLLQRLRAAVSKAKGMDIDDGGGIAGAKENAKEFDSAPPSAERDEPPAKEPVNDPAKDPAKDSAKNPVNDPAKDPATNPPSLGEKLPAEGKPPTVAGSKLDPTEWVARLKSMMTEEEASQFKAMTHGSDAEVQARYRGNLDAAHQQVKNALAGKQGKAAFSKVSRSRATALRAKAEARGLLKDSEVAKIFDKLGENPRAEAMRLAIEQLRNRLISDVVGDEIALQYPGKEVLRNVKISEQRSGDSIEDYMKNHAKRDEKTTTHGLRVLDGADGKKHVYLDRTDIDMMVVERGSDGKLRIVHREEVKTGRRDQATGSAKNPGAKEQLAYGKQLLSAAAHGKTTIRMEAGGVDITHQFDLNSVDSSTGATRGPANKPDFDQSLGVTADDLEAMIEELIQEQLKLRAGAKHE